MLNRYLQVIYIRYINMYLYMVFTMWYIYIYIYMEENRAKEGPKRKASKISKAEQGPSVGKEDAPTTRSLKKSPKASKKVVDKRAYKPSAYGKAKKAFEKRCHGLHTF